MRHLNKSGILSSLLLSVFACLPLLAETLPVLPEDALPLNIATNGNEVACAWSATGARSPMDGSDGYPKGKEFLSVGARVIGPVDMVRDLGWSADGKRLAYTLWTGKRIALYLDYVKIAEFDARPYVGMTFSWAPAGSSFYAEGLKNGYSTLITPEGETRLGKAAPSPKGSLEDMPISVSIPGFSNAVWASDGSRLFYMFTSKEGTSLFEGAKKLAAYEAAGALAVSPAGSLAYAIQEGDAIFLMRKGQRLGPYDSVVHPAWSPVGEKLLYTVRNKDATCDAFIDGTPMSESLFGPIKNFNASYGAWPPDGSDPAIAYDAFLANVGGSMIYTGSERRGPYKTSPSGIIGFGNWAPLGKKLAYMATKTDGTMWAFVGDEEIGPLDAKSAAIDFHWAPDALSYAVCLRPDKLLVNGKTYSVDGKAPYIVGWSADSRILAYRTSAGPKLLVDGVEYTGALFGTRAVVFEDRAFRFL